MQNTTLQSQEQNQSDYDTEWGLDNDSPSNSDIVNSDETSSSDAPATVTDESALEGQANASPSSDESKAAELENNTTWADATPDQIKAFNKAEGDEKAMRGRYRLSNDKNSMLERELNELRVQNADYQAKLRVPTQFEQDHPEYAEDLNKLYGNREGVPAPVAVDPAELIISAHPDAGEVYNSNEFQTWVGAQPKPVRQAIESSDAESINEILTLYKSTATSKPFVPNPKAGLQELSGTGGSSASIDLRTTSSLTASEQYDREWAAD